MPQNSKPKSKIAATFFKGPQERSENSSRKKNFTRTVILTCFSWASCLTQYETDTGSECHPLENCEAKNKKTQLTKKNHKGSFSVLPTAIRLTSETFSDIILGTDGSKGEHLKEKG